MRRSLIQGLLGVAGSQLSSRNSLPLLQKGILTSASRILLAAELEASPENIQHIKDEEAFSPHSTPALAEAWVMAGAPASTQPALGGGGIPLTSNYQLFFYVGGHFLAKDSPLHAWLTTPLLIYLFGIQFAFVKMSKGTRKTLNIRFTSPASRGPKMLEALMGIEVTIEGEGSHTVRAFSQKSQGPGEIHSILNWDEDGVSEIIAFLSQLWKLRRNG